MELLEYTHLLECLAAKGVRLASKRECALAKMTGHTPFTECLAEKAEVLPPKRECHVAKATRHAPIADRLAAKAEWYAPERECHLAKWPLPSDKRRDVQTQKEQAMPKAEDVPPLLVRVSAEVLCVHPLLVSIQSFLVGVVATLQEVLATTEDGPELCAELLT